MFTGIVETIGTVTSVEKIDETSSGGGGHSIVVKVDAEMLQGLKLGDSVAINGTCLTITQFTEKDSFKFQVSPETLRKTNLGLLAVNSRVNVERAMRANQRFDGHFVQGHVDSTIQIISVTQDYPSLVYTFAVPPASEATGNIDLMTYIVPKGYVCLDGTSLTVVDVAQRTFSVMLIKYTQERVIMSGKTVGDSVNLEVDQMGKYVESVVTNVLFGGTKPSFVPGSSSSSLLESMIASVVDERIKKALG